MFCAGFQGKTTSYPGTILIPNCREMIPKALNQVAIENETMRRMTRPLKLSTEVRRVKGGMSRSHHSMHNRNPPILNGFVQRYFTGLFMRSKVSFAIATCFKRCRTIPRWFGIGTPSENAVVLILLCVQNLKLWNILMSQ